jgi:hypothetical protein
MSNTSKKSSAVTAAHFIARADAVCERLDLELGVGEPPHLTIQELVHRAPMHALLERRALKKLARLDAPTALAGDWHRILLLREALAQDLVALGRDAQLDDQDGIRKIVASKRRLHHVLFTLAARDGFRYCSRATPARGVLPAQASRNPHATTS